MKRAEMLELVAHHPDFRDLDVLALQEASAHESNDDATAIAGLLGKAYAAYQHTYHHIKSRPQANGLVWNTHRVRFDSVDHHTLPSSAEVLIPRAERAVLNRLKPQPRVNLVGDGAWDGVSLRVCAAHLDVIGYRFKQRQFRAILDDLASRAPAQLTLLAGDFNTFQIRGRPTWAQLKRDAASLDLRAISDEIPWTQAVRALRFRQKLDEIFVASVAPYTAKVWTLDAQGSDHLPVFAEIEFS